MKPEELSDWATLEKYCKPAFDFLLATSDAIDRQHKADWSHIGRTYKALGDEVKGFGERRREDRHG